jgi:hypothetical protein
MQTWHFLSIVSVIITILLGIIGYLVKRAVFGAIDDLKKKVEANMTGKVGVELCIKTHQMLTEILDDVKETLKENGKTLQQVAIDIAVLKKTQKCE